MKKENGNMQAFLSAFVLAAVTVPFLFAPDQIVVPDEHGRIVYAVGRAWVEAGLPEPGDCLNGLAARSASSRCAFDDDLANATPESVAHHALHELVHCMRLSTHDRYDHKHELDRVWSRTHGDMSAQSRARRKLIGE